MGELQELKNELAGIQKQIKDLQEKEKQVKARIEPLGVDIFVQTLEKMKGKFFKCSVEDSKEYIKIISWEWDERVCVICYNTVGNTEKNYDALSNQKVSVYTYLTRDKSEFSIRGILEYVVGWFEDYEEVCDQNTIDKLNKFWELLNNL